MIADNIAKEQNRCDPDSLFEIEFTDGSKISELDCRWSKISTEKKVKYGLGSKLVMTCNFPVKRVRIKMKDLETVVDVAPDQEVYQYMKGSTTFMPGGDKKERILGRGIGLIKNEKVVEERFMNTMTNEITGFRV